MLRRPARSSRARATWLVGAVALAPPLAVGGFVRQRAEPAELGQRLLSQVLERVDRFAVDSSLRDALYGKAARGLVEQLGDPYASLFSPRELATFTREEIGS